MMHHLRSLLLFITCCYCLPLFANSDFLQQKNVQEYMSYLVNTHHFHKKDIDYVFAHIEPRAEVIRRINKPYEKTYWNTYQQTLITPLRIKNGVEFWLTHQQALERAERKYGVPASIIVATIGIETKYGQKLGNFRVIDSLSSLAFKHTRRAAFFQNELTQFLLLCREQQLNPLKMMGSYAGAIGQPQFMPSSYRNYAVDFSGKNKIDLIHNTEDAIGSVANYYQKHGWKTHQNVALPVDAVGLRYAYLRKKGKVGDALSLNELHRYGLVSSLSQQNDPQKKVKIIELVSRYRNEYWVGFHNFAVIKRYNRSDLYAMAVFQLSKHIETARKKHV